MAVWPSQFCPIIDSFQESPPENIIRSDMDVGPAKVRRRTTANIRPISFNMFLTKAETALLDSFFLNDVMSGAIPFDFIHPRTDQLVSARFVEPPQYSNRSIGYNVSISLEILP